MKSNCLAAKQFYKIVSEAKTILFHFRRGSVALVTHAKTFLFHFDFRPGFTLK